MIIINRNKKQKLFFLTLNKTTTLCLQRSVRQQY